MSAGEQAAVLDGIKYDSSGLVTAVVQDASDGQVLMVAYMDREALRRTLDSGATCFYSRARKEYWVKGAPSGNTQRVAPESSVLRGASRSMYATMRSWPSEASCTTAVTRPLES